MSSLLAQIENRAIGNLGTNDPSGDSLADILGAAINMLFIFSALLFLFFIIVSGINWMTAEGKPDKVEKSRNTLINALTGLALVAAAVALTSFIGNALDIEFLKTLNFIFPSI